MAGTRDARTRIVRAAQDLFYERGIAAAGVDLIAEHAAVGKMSLYRHFPGKTELVVEALRERDVGHLDWLLPEENRPGPIRVARMFNRIARAARRPGFHGCPFVRAAAELPAGHPALRVVQAHKDRLRSRLEGIARSAKIEGPGRVARQLVLLADGASTECVVRCSDAPARAAGELAMLVLETAPRRS